MADFSTVLDPGATTVGVVGVGAMGAGMANSLLRAGFTVHVLDRRPEAVAALVAQGAVEAVDLPGLAAVADLILVVVLDDDQVTSVVRPLLAASGRTRTVVVASTIFPETVTSLQEEAEPVGVRILDAAVSGGSEKSALGALAIIVGGPEAAVAQCAPVFDAIGERTFHVGPTGAGAAGKLVNNLLSLGGYFLQLEAMQLAAAYGISEDAATEIVTASAGDSRGIRTWGRLDRVRATHTLAGTPEMYELTAKDIRIAAKAALQHGIELPIATLTGDLVPSKLAERDRLLAERADAPIPLCNLCHQELAHPFRAAGRHPECADPASPLHVS